MIWFAHSIKGRPESEWESPEKHAAWVADGASRRANKFSMSLFGKIAGVLHDLGKYNPEFLVYIRGQRKRGPDHSSAGAVFAWRQLGFFGKVVAHCIAGHHAGLSDKLFVAGGRLDRNRNELGSVIARAKADGFPLPDTLATSTLPPSGFSRAFLIRFLFSCLVDADRVATETFYNGGVPADRDFRAGPSELADRLALSMANQQRRREETGEAGTPVNALRADVLASVMAKAEIPQSVFTLTVPTGGGKTLTVLRFALDHARHHKLDRVIVVVPFVAVTEQWAQVCREMLPGFEDQILEHHSAFEDAAVESREDRDEGRTPLQFAIDTWDAPLVVTTAVQFLESLFAASAGKCRKLHNMARSVVVLDEAQTIPLHLLRPCVAALKELHQNYGTTVVLCTATQPALEDKPDEHSKPPHVRRSFEGGFIGVKELAPDADSLFQALKRVDISYIGEQEDETLAARIGAADQALCIVNSRAHARELFELLKQNGAGGVRHLSTFMLPEDRRRVLDEIKADLKAKRPCRVVATSLVEAGIDFSFPLVLRAEAGLEQIIQAAGRANRNGELGDGRLADVLVFRAKGRKTLRGMEDNITAARSIFRKYEDVLTPAAMQDYFLLLYWTKMPNGLDGASADELDRHGILAQCAAAAEDLDFAFATIAKEMRLITDVNVPLIVPLSDEARADVETLRHADQPGQAIRRLQRWTVNLAPSARLKLVADRAAEVVRSDRYGEAFVVLTNLSLYDEEVGLRPEDPLFVRSDLLVI